MYNLGGLQLWMTGMGIERGRVSGEDLVYSADPLAKLLLGRLGLTPRGMAVAALAWGALYVVVLPAALGSLRSAGDYLGSLADWHAQLLMFLVFPSACAFYAWQPRGIVRVYEAMGLPAALPDLAKGYRSRAWPVLGLAVAVAVVLFDTPKMVASYGSWWMVENWMTILGREGSLALAFYMMGMMAGRQFVTTLEWRRILARPTAVSGLRAASTYGLSLALLLAVLGLRLSVEGIELPHRVGAITPDYYAKIAGYLLVGLVCFFSPLSSSLRRGHALGLNWLVVGLELLGILSLPLLGFLLLRFLLRA